MAPAGRISASRWEYFYTRLLLEVRNRSLGHLLQTDPPGIVIQNENEFRVWTVLHAAEVAVMPLRIVFKVVSVMYGDMTLGVRWHGM